MKRFRNSLNYVIPILTFVATITAPTFGATPTYLASDLGQWSTSLQGVGSTALGAGGVSNAHAVATFDPNLDIVEWTSGGGFNYLLPNNYGGTPTAINSNGYITGGVYADSSGDQYGLYAKTGVSYLNNVGLGIVVQGNAINSSGAIAGYSSDGSGTIKGAYWASSSSVPSVLLEPLPYQLYVVQVQGLNDSNVMTGFYQIDGTNTDVIGFRHTYNSANTRLMTSENLSPLTAAGKYCAGLGINASGEIAGYAYSSSTVYHAVLYPAGSSTPVDLGTLGGATSVATAIDTRGDVVGYSLVTGNAYYDAFLWTPTAANGTTGTMVDLNNLITSNTGAPLTTADSINDSGQILCEAFLSGDTSEYHALLLTPVSKLSISDVGALTGATGTSQAYGINNQAEVVGSSITTTGTAHAFKWTKAGSITDLGTLTGGTESGATCVSDDGVIGGYSYSSKNNGPHSVSISASGTITDLGTLGATSNTGLYSRAFGISGSSSMNTIDAITGSSETSNQLYHAYYWNPTNSSLSDLDLVRTDSLIGGSYSSGYGFTTFNSVESIIGESDSGIGNLASFISDEATSLSSLNNLLSGGVQSSAYAGDIYGDIAGAADTIVSGVSETHAFLYQQNGSTITDMTTLPSTLFHFSAAYAINSLSIVVGQSYTDSGYHAMLATIYNSVPTMVDLNTWLPTGSGWTLNCATGINNMGQITGYGTIGGATHAFVLGPP